MRAGLSVMSPMEMPLASDATRSTTEPTLPNGAASASSAINTTNVRSTADSNTPACSSRDTLRPVLSRMVWPTLLSALSSQVEKSSTNLNSSVAASTTMLPPISCWFTNLAKFT
ncbi:hypothetical protein D3C73_1073510 [compost metagenome]